MTEKPQKRAVLVVPDKRHPDTIVRVVSSNHLANGLPLERTAYDAAGEQPRIRWCVEHLSSCYDNESKTCLRADGWIVCRPCRVVSAVVVVEEEE